MKSFALGRLITKRSFGLALKYSKNGVPKDVLKLEEVPPLSTNIKPNEVFLKVLASPINPSDVNMIEGVYGVKATLPAVGGNEGVAEVVKVGENVKDLQVGDHVVPAVTNLGMWRQEIVTDSNNVLKVSKRIKIPFAATISVNPATAYRLLRDFAELQPGDVIIQNLADSGVGLCVVQMAREMGIRTINIVNSERPLLNKTLKLITNLGGDFSIPSHLLETDTVKNILAELPPVKLALNGIGGEVASSMIRVLPPGTTVVTYGGMSKHAPIVPLDVLTDKNIQMKGFWLTRWNESASREERTTMYQEIADMICNHDNDDIPHFMAKNDIEKNLSLKDHEGTHSGSKLSTFLEMHDLDDFEYALKRMNRPYANRKIVLNIAFPDRFAEHDQLTDKDYEMFTYPLSIA